MCTLLRKPDAVRADLDIDCIGFDIPNEFVVGYGLDYAERYRDLPYIGTLDPKVYEQPLIARSVGVREPANRRSGARQRHDPYSTADLPVL